MPETTFCPYCNAKLRIARASKRPQRVKCTVCKSHFHPSQVISGQSNARWLNQPLQGAGDDGNADQGDLGAGAAPETAAVEFAPPAEDSINPEVIKAAYPEEMLERREARRQNEKERTRDTSRRKHRRRARGFQKALVVLLVGAGMAGLAGAAWYLLRPGPPRIETVATPTPVPDDEPRISTPTPLELDFAPKPLPKRLIGVWELRSDDERRGWIEFRSDNTLSMKAWRGVTVQSPLNANWFLIQEEGDDLVFEIGPRRGTMGNPRYFITLNGPDAFTLTDVAEMGHKSSENSRFVRWTPPPAMNP